MPANRQNIRTICSDPRKINAVYFGTAETVAETDWNELDPAANQWSFMQTVTEPGTYRFVCHDSVGNISESEPATYQTYKIYNLLETVSGITGNYDMNSYAVQNNSGPYIAETGTLVPPESVYTIPTPESSAANFKGVSTSYAPEIAELIQDPVLEEDDTVFYMWFDRNVYPLTLDTSEGVNSVSGAGSYKHGTEVDISAEIHHLYTFTKWRKDSGDEARVPTDAETSVILTGPTALTATAEDVTPPNAPTVKREDNDTFSFSSDAEDFAGYYVSASGAKPDPNGPGWTTNTTYDINNVVDTWYVYVKDTHGNVSEAGTINVYTVVRATHGTVLTTRYDDSNGDSFSGVTRVLDGSPIYVEASLKTAYKDLDLTVNDETISSGSVYTVHSNTAVVAGSTATEIVTDMPMQDIRQEHCDASPLEKEYVVTDMRADNKKYLVARMADGHCWMKQNLALPGGTRLTSADSEIEGDATYTLPESKASGFSYIASGSTEAMYDGTHKDGEHDSMDDNTGAFYSFNVATTGNGSVIQNRKILTSICPRAWTIPDRDGEWPGLFSAYGNDYDTLAEKFNIERIGRYHGRDIQYGGDRAYWWSARSASLSSNTAYNVWFGYGDILGIINRNNKTYSLTDSSENGNGETIRCMLDNTFETDAQNQNPAMPEFLNAVNTAKLQVE